MKLKNFKVARGVSRFKKRMANEAADIAKQQKAREVEKARRKAKKAKAAAKVFAKADRILAKIKREAEIQSFLELNSREIISRRRQGQSSKQISERLGLPATRINRYLRGCGYIPI